MSKIIFRFETRTKEEGLKQESRSAVGDQRMSPQRTDKAKGSERSVFWKIDLPSNHCVKEAVRAAVVESLKGKYKICGPTFVWDKLIFISVLLY